MRYAAHRLVHEKETAMGLKTGIVGAAGFAGAELVRLLVRHPEFDVAVITSNSDEGQLISSVYPSLLGVCDLPFSRHDDARLASCDVVFMATPHTVAMSMAPALLEAGVTVIDLSADYRLRNKDTFEAWYGVPHTSPELLATAAFGLPELEGAGLAAAAVRRAQGEAVLVACAGCYPTATSLAAAPAVDLCEGIVVADAVSGVTGAGRSANARTHFCSANENFEAYGVGRHRHTPEIEQILGLTNRLVFTPHLAPASRGLLSTVTLQLNAQARQQHTLESIHRLYTEAYGEGTGFVRVLPLGQQPKTSSVVGTNNAHVGLAMNEATGCLVATCAIDNLLKGAAGQAVQCANIVCGFDQELGLTQPARAV